MQKLYFLTVIVSLFSFQFLSAQKPKKPNAVEIYNQIQKLNFLGSVLYIAAHPDDENTRLISYLSNEKKARTGYLSLTRGDGGQNLIGPELREQLGVIRTQELIEARKIDGGEQFFTRANDFGYSKTPDESLEIWNKNEVLSDVIYVIRQFQPDVIINRFDARTPETTHGHHTASALLSIEAFDETNNPTVFPNQLKWVQPWQAKRLFFNTSWWFYGSKEKFDQADKSNLVALQTGVYYPSIGKSNQEIAALSRSCHQSQGFGSTGSRGEETEYLEFLKGDAMNSQFDIFEGIDTSWNRVKNGKKIGEYIATIIKNYDFNNPSASVPDLVKAYGLIQNLEDTHWKTIKTKEIINIIGDCSGLFLEAVAENQETLQNEILKVKVEAINRSTIPMQLVSLQTFPKTTTPVSNFDLKNNTVNNFTLELPITETINYTQPYWLKEPSTLGMYQVNNQEIIGTPDVIREINMTFTIAINGTSIPFNRMVIYKYNDNVKGEIYNPLDVVPKVTTSIDEKVAIFNGEKTKTISVNVRAGTDNSKGEVVLELPKNWKVSPASKSFSLTKKGESQKVVFAVTAPNQSEEISAKSVAIVDGEKYDIEKNTINYNHISKQQILKPAEAKFVKLDLKINHEKIAYIMGAGDEVPQCLKQMGYEVMIIKPDEISTENLKNFNVVITGIRAYNTINELAYKQNILFDYVKAGHTMIVQYNTNKPLVTNEIAPFPLKISRDRVTQENALVTFLEPKNAILNVPNKITEKDFTNWKQEQGLYYPDEWDANFTPIISSHDKGETAKKGAILVAQYGKGYYIYTGLSFFRELPEGVPGAYRLLANMISLKQ